MTEYQIIMRWKNAEASVARLGLKIEVSSDMYLVTNTSNLHFASGANWSFATLDGILGWVSGIDLGRMMK